MSATTGVVLLWLIPAAAALTVWTRSWRRRRADRATETRALRGALDNLGSVVRHRTWQRDTWHAAADRATSEREVWQAVALRHLRTANGLRHTLRQFTRERRRLRRQIRTLTAENERLLVLTQQPAPSDLDRAREKRDKLGRFAKAVAK